VPTRDHALRRRCREPGAHEVDHPLGREAVREHDSFGAAITAGGEQFERAAVALGIWAVRSHETILITTHGTVS
jgi:hypothetical protein